DSSSSRGRSDGPSRGRGTYNRDSGRNAGRGFSRDSSRGGFGRDSRRGGSDLEMTKVICSSCKEECEVPFRPTSNKPVYCRDCFSKDGEGSSSNRGGSNNSSPSNRDLDVINEKLNKIMAALKIR
ncbi:CxxC-x17-CxxC domain-containing protein, partial [Candidatus Venteria ishoeyi]|uniref:CxxC-x17-CxxC domain-containing protein n=1 Tax=Candidatus Venteria ishoeyi TaxID=1899563 RepID=UPI00255C8F05